MLERNIVKNAGVGTLAMINMVKSLQSSATIHVLVIVPRYVVAVIGTQSTEEVGMIHVTEIDDRCPSDTSPMALKILYIYAGK